MASGRFSKNAAPYFSLGKLNPRNNNIGDTVIGGAVTAAPGNGLRPRRGSLLGSSTAPRMICWYYLAREEAR